MSLALARKYRPRRFADVAVQSHVSETLQGAIARGRVAHGYLLCGPRGVGKTTLARVLAMALNCDRRAEGAGEPCGGCDSCHRIWSGSASLDVVEIDAASNRGVDDARELRERAMYAPSGEDRYKVYIVDEAHMLTREAWNALLKVLEEPPPRVVFVFATTEPQKIAQTAAPVLSRLQRFDFKRIGPAEIRARLATVLAAENVRAESDALAMIARAADGSMRDALSLTDQTLSLGDGALTVERVRAALGLIAEDEYIALLDLVAERRAADAFETIGRLADAGVDFGAVLAGFGDMLRAQLAVTLGGVAPDVSDRARAELESRRDRLASADLLRMLAALTELEPRFRRSAQQQLLLETLLIRFALLDRSVAIEEVLRGLGASGKEREEERKGEGEGEGEGTGEKESDVKREPRAFSDTGRAPSSDAAGPRRSAPAASAAEAPHIGERFDDPGRAGRALLADVPRGPGAGRAPLDLNQLAERWDEVIDRVRASGRATLAGVLQHVVPVAITGSGVVTVQLDERNDFYAEALESGEREVREALSALFSGVDRVVLRHAAPSPPPAPARRMTAASIRSERLASLRKRDPLLDAAVDALDLELMD